MKKLLLSVGVCFVIVMGLLVFSRTVDAYAIGAAASSPVAFPAAPSWLSNAFNAVTQWFEDIMAQGAQSTGALAIPITVSGPLGSVTVSAQNLFAQFDAWLYGIIHFHIALIFNFLFGLVGWILGIAKNIVDWLNSIFRSAAGR